MVLDGEAGGEQYGVWEAGDRNAEVLDDFVGEWDAGADGGAQFASGTRPPGPGCSE